MILLALRQATIPQCALDMADREIGVTCLLTRDSPGARHWLQGNLRDLVIVHIRGNTIMVALVKALTIIIRGPATKPALGCPSVHLSLSVTASHRSGVIPAHGNPDLNTPLKTTNLLASRVHRIPKKT